MAIVPDTKDWTWVLQRRCPECRLDTQAFPRESVPEMVLANAAAWQQVLTGDLGARPTPGTWSALEYGCHVRDVFRLYDERLDMMLSRDDPLFPNWDQDETATVDRYAEQQPAQVAVKLNKSAQLIAHRFRGVTGDQWQRTGNRGDGATFSSPWKPSPGTSSTTLCTTSTTSQVSAPKPTPDWPLSQLSGHHWAVEMSSAAGSATSV